MFVTTRISVSPADGHFLAGFLEAEGSFGLRLNNGGESWQCQMSLGLRDDDAALLVEMARLTGLGRLNRVSPNGTSNPQVVWRIVRHADCRRLTELLREFPLRGRKRREQETWSQAVDALSNDPRPASAPLAHARIHELRRYVDPEHRDRESVCLPEDAFAAYLGGFFTGEGHFSISGTQVRTVLKVREDDRPLLEALATATGLGSIYLTGAYRTSKPAAAWVIHRRDQLPRAVELLERARLRGRKLREFEVWREAALAVAKPSAKRSRDLIHDTAARLKEIRAYSPPLELPPPGDRLGERQRAYAQILRDAARVIDGPLTGPTYSTARAANPEWPTRNTIAAAFGTWAGALEASGLDERCTVHARLHARVRRGDYSDAELRERRATRQQVLDAVTGLIGQRPRHPTVHEYLAYRAANDRSLPSLSRLYNLFPAGWWSVLRQAGLPARPRLRG